MEIILYEPEIPPNTGNIARFCAGLDIPLNLIEPLGFKIDDKHLKRAGLDYWPHVSLKIWPDWPTFLRNWRGGRLIGSSAKAMTLYTDMRMTAADGLVFGPETRGLPEFVRAGLDLLVRVPLRPAVRSLNLATTVGIVTGEALRQTGLWPREGA
ncbi:MAG: tRNA (cytidine(34)-2'-O)-methyltransferase [Candidatus Adiutrix sp.]|jgi:tRNA (cytidine/uridine-2'-O-)-methyltransferase|nr:tRNA (cytidine(34)-2'-O)-methyltransferase [Candidatus Adiutrix sp.]